MLHAVFRTAKREELIDSNPAEAAERPRVRRKRWRILEPVEVARVAKAFTDRQARVVFLTLVLTGIRRSELQALRWRDVSLIEKVLRVRDSEVGARRAHDRADADANRRARGAVATLCLPGR